MPLATRRKDQLRLAIKSILQGLSPLVPRVQIQFSELFSWTIRKKSKKIKKNTKMLLRIASDLASALLLLEILLEKKKVHNIQHRAPKERLCRWMVGYL